MMPTQEDLTKDFMGQLIGKVYDTLTNNNLESLGPNNFIAFDPIGKVLMSNSFDFAINGIFGIPPKPKPILDSKGNQVVDANGKPQFDMIDYQNMVNSTKNGNFLKMEQFAAITDEVHDGVPPLLPSGKGRAFAIFNPTGKSISKGYGDLMDWCEVADSTIDPKVETKLAKMRDKLSKTKVLKNPEFDPDEIESDTNLKMITQTFVSPMYKKYLEYAIKYNDVLETNNAIRIAADNGDSDAAAQISIDGKNMKKREDMALQAWSSMGFKESVEQMQNYIAEVEAKSILTLKKRLEKEYRNNLRTKILEFTDYSVSSPIPAEAIQLSSGWTKFDSKTMASSSSYNHSVHAASIKAGFNALFVKGNAGSSFNRDSMNSNFSSEDFSFSFKIGKVAVARGWLNQNFLESKYWRLANNSPQSINKDILSDGNGKGLLSSLITELIMVKDVSFKFNTQSANYSKIKTHFDAGGGFSFGPFFNSSAKYSYDNTNIQSSSQFKNGELSSPDISIIGYKCRILPKSPNTDPSIKKFVSATES